MMEGLPKDPILLLSVVNTKLRDFYPGLNELCRDLGVDKHELEKKLERIVEDWEQEPDYLRLYNRKDLRSRDRRKFCEDSERLTQALKDSYRAGM